METKNSKSNVTGYDFNSRRSPVFSTMGMVASSQTLATQAGLDILKKGGNAVDAAIAVSAALTLLEPTSTSIGGDCFLLFFDAKKKNIFGLNGSGKSPQNLTLEIVENSIGTFTNKPQSAHTVNVPGAVHGWLTALSEWGTMSPMDVLQPTINLAEDGFPVGFVASKKWKEFTPLLDPSPKVNRETLLKDGRAPETGEIFTNPHLAKVLRKIGKEGVAGFYEGEVAEDIVDVVQRAGGVLTLDDLKLHTSLFCDPVTTKYKDMDIFELPPNGQGMTALIALNILKDFDLNSMGHNSPEYLHHCIEALRLAFEDSMSTICDPSKFEGDPYNHSMLSPEHIKQRQSFILPNKRNPEIKLGYPVYTSDTVGFQTADKYGNVVSMVNSTFMPFGSGLIPNCGGFVLHNRGLCFSCTHNHPNCVQGGIRPYHTIIPGMALKDGELHTSFTITGGYMQPQSHVQILMNILEFGMNPQSAIDAARFSITPETLKMDVLIEEGISEETCTELVEMGHNIYQGKPLADHVKFGNAEVIQQRFSDGKRVWVGASDGRGDGQACGFNYF